MDRRLLRAATSGDSVSLKELAAENQSMLFGTTPQGNTCLHISSAHGHEEFCKDVLALNHSLISKVNLQKETPLVAAVTGGHVTLASLLLTYCSNETILEKDKHKCNALHHAIHCGHRNLALELIRAEPALSQGVSEYDESPIFVAVMRDFTDVSEKLLAIPDCAYSGPHSYNALHAAVRNGNSVIAKKIMDTCPQLATEESMRGSSPVKMAVLRDKIVVLRVLLEHDCSLGYGVTKAGGIPLLVYAAYRGRIDVARELLDHCPDSPYCKPDGWTCLHEAVDAGQTKFAEFILGVPQLRKLVNMRDDKGKTDLHYAVQKCNLKIVAALLSHKDTDTTLVDKGGLPAAWELRNTTDSAKTLNWNEVCMLMSEADPQNATSLSNLHAHAMKDVTNKSRKDAKSLTQTYTSNTSLVAILMATITFAAAFTLPGGYSNDAGSQGIPVMARNIAFQAFLISDTLAMCSSLAVAFICIIARWEGFEFLIYYRSYTKKLMWFAYTSTTTAFATGLYTALATRLQWLAAIMICFLPALLPILTKLLGEWPVLRLRFRLGHTFKSDLLDMV
ncbi:hypothetical protein ACQ4PT_047063 [Festuca glaucescens]